MLRFLPPRPPGGHPSCPGGEYSQSPAIQRSSPPGTGGVPSVAGGGGRKFEYFDEDFHSYWEDVDLSWRMSNAGWKNIFVPSAIGYHGRGAGSSEKGYADVVRFHPPPQKPSCPRPPAELPEPHFYVHKKSRSFLPAVFCPGIFYVLLCFLF